MKQYKLLFLGPVASGKTTAVRSLCGDSFVSTEALATDKVKEIKNETTVAMDYGVLTFGGDKRLHVYGAPGQDRFRFMMEILLEGCLGAALLINVSRTKLPDILSVVHAYENFIAHVPCAIGLTHTEYLSEAEVKEYEGLLKNRYQNITDVLLIDPRNKKDVARLVENIILKIK